MGKRIYYLDSVSAILLIHMIVGHCCQWSQTYTYYISWTYWLNFFMPWFFFKAGMFFKRRPLAEEFHKSFHRLLIPYICFTILGTFILWIKLIANHELTFRSILSPVASILKTGAAHGNLALWFLLSLFCVRIIFCLISSKIATANRLSTKYLWGGYLALACCVFLPVYYILDINGIRYPLYISNISSGMMFFTIGYLLRNHVSTKYETLALLVVYVIMIVYLPMEVDMRSGHLNKGFFVLWVPISVTGILAINGVFHNFFNKYNILSRIGSQTMSYYCMHWCVIIMVSMFFAVTENVPNIPFLIALIIANMVILPIATYLIKNSRFSYIIQ